MKKGFGGFFSILLVLGLAVSSRAQIHTYVLGDRENSWESGGNGVEPVRIEGRGAARLDTGNTPGNAIEFEHRPGWVSPRFFDGQTNIASLVLEKGASIKAPNSMNIRSSLLKQQLEGTVNGDHEVAYERKPTLFNTLMPAFGIWIILDFARQVGVERIRFYPRNTVVANAYKSFHNDFLRGYEVWVNPRLTNTSEGAPDILVKRDPQNGEPVVDLPVDPQYARLVKLRSITETPFEIDEIEVYGTGYLGDGAYYSDLIDLGERVTVGPVRWTGRTVGDPLFSKLQVQMRTGNDDLPIAFRKKVYVGSPFDQELVLVEIAPEEYWEMKKSSETAFQLMPLIDDVEDWSTWKSLENGKLHVAPVPRRFVQFLFKFKGRLFDTRQVDRVLFQYLKPPIADTLRAEVFPRLADAEKPATFQYAVLLKRNGPILGIDRLEVDTIVPSANIRDLTVDGEPVDFEVEEITKRRFRLALPLIARDGAVLRFTFDIPVFRFGTTFSGRAYNSRFPSVPQRLEPGQVVDFGEGDFDEVSGLAVVIPKPQIGKLVGQIVFFSRVFTPNGDGVNDELEVFFNLLQLVKPAPVCLEIYDLAGQQVHVVFAEERGIGPAIYAWDGRLSDGRLIRPGNYAWVLRVQADAFEERHSGVIAVAY